MAERWPSGFPWGTLVINVSGSFLLGVLFGLEFRRVLPPDARLALAIGLIGAYTTFSTWSVETLRLAQSGSYGLAAVNAIGSTMLGLVAAWLGVALGRLV